MAHIYTNEDFARYLGVDYEKKGDIIRIICPFHGDTHPSMVIYPDIERGSYCFACGEAASWAWLAHKVKNIDYKEVLKDLGQETLQPSQIKRTFKVPSMSFCETPPKRFKTAYNERLARCTVKYPSQLLKWLTAKNMGLTAHELGWRWQSGGVFRNWGPGLIIPYMLNGECQYVRFRALKPDGSFAKPKGPFDVPIQPYFTTFRPNDTVFICEGESDAASLYAIGASAIGIPGALSRKAINSAVAFVGDYPYVKKIVACGDNDAAGQKMNKLIINAIANIGVRVKYDEYHVNSTKEKADINDDYVEGKLDVPIEMTANYGENYNRQPWADKDFGAYVYKMSEWVYQKELEGLDVWGVLNKIAKK